MPPPADAILFLGPSDSSLLDWLRVSERRIVQTAEMIDHDFITANRIAFLVSYGYRHILRAPVLDLLPDRAINLHISLLPWNRGADPNLWSFIDDTPKGVTIHYLDTGIDTGDIIAQEQISFLDIGSETLATTYARLDTAVQDLFKETWSAIKSGNCERRPQSTGGSYHAIADRSRVAGRLTEGWDTPIRDLIEAKP
ncbi:MAG: formyltransferase family protein [Gammaproteobacteria bacterium]